jgi:hypothetical protein
MKIKAPARRTEKKENKFFINSETIRHRCVPRQSQIRDLFCVSEFIINLKVKVKKESKLMIIIIIIIIVIIIIIIIIQEITCIWPHAGRSIQRYLISITARL